MHPTPLQILSHVPAWVFAVLALLLWAGGRQCRPRSMARARVAILPAVLCALSLLGVASAFGGQPLALGAWAAGMAGAAALAARRTPGAGARWDPAAGVFHLPGSAVPLALMLGLFAIRFAAGTALALQPARARDPAWAGALGAAYGAFSGLFAARALALLRLARRGDGPARGAARLPAAGG